MDEWDDVLPSARAHQYPRDAAEGLAWRKLTIYVDEDGSYVAPRRLEWMSMPGLEGSDYRQNGFASSCEAVSTD
jgi:hypothetical protein